MQISKDVYINIEVPDVDKGDFLKASDMPTVRITESAGTILPWAVVSFRTNDATLDRYFKQNNMIKLSLGSSANDADTFPIIVERAEVDVDASNSVRTIRFCGFMYNKNYMIDQVDFSVWGNSYRVVQKVYREKVGKLIKSNIGAVLENEVEWINPKKPPYAFLMDVILHMRLYPSFPLVAIDKFGDLILKDFVNTCKEGPKYTLVNGPTTNTNEYQMMESFNVKNNRDVYNMFSGNNKKIEVTNTTSGSVTPYFANNVPLLASSKISEGMNAGSMTSSNEMQSTNVHKWYKETFIYNSNNQVALSSITGEALLAGPYRPEIAPLDLVKVISGGNDKTIDGLYLVETVTTELRVNSGLIYTKLKLTRDNKNYIENYVKKEKGLKIRSKLLQDLCRAVHSLRVAYAIGQQFIDGTYMRKLQAFAIASKRNMLRMFSVAGVSADFNSRANLLKSMICIGNSLMNSLVSMLFPAEIAYVFRDFLLTKPSLQALLLKYVSVYVPYELQSIINDIINSLSSTTNSLNSIAKDNGIKVTAGTEPEEGETDLADEDISKDPQQRVVNVINNFSDKTAEIDIPFPVIDITESESLLPDEEFKELIADKTIINLSNLGYLSGTDAEELKDVLLDDKKELSFNLVQRINANAGNSYNFKYWGTYNDPIELTSFFIAQAYKDKYRTIPCSKLINATKGAKIFFACPKAEKNLSFYIRSKRVEIGKELKSFDIKLGQVDSYGNDIWYTVYYTVEGFNSNSVLFEVKQGGMV